MKFTFLPKTKLGKVSVGSVFTFIVTWTVYLILIYPMFMTGTDKPALSEVLLFSLPIAGIIAIFVGFVTGVVALFKKRPFCIAHYRNYIILFDQWFHGFVYDWGFHFIK